MIQPYEENNSNPIIVDEHPPMQNTQSSLFALAPIPDTRLYDCEPVPPSLPDELLAQGVKAVMAYLAPDSNQIMAEMAQQGLEQTLFRLQNRIRYNIMYEQAVRLELGWSLFWIDNFHLWDKVGGAYKSFREWAESEFPGTPYSDIDLWIRFYKLFSRCIEQGISPESMLSPKPLTPYKLGLINSHFKATTTGIESDRKALGADSPQLDTTITKKNQALKEEIDYIMETDEDTLKKELADRSYRPEEIRPVSVYIQCHIQSGGSLIVDHSSIPRTEEAMTAIRAGKIIRRWQLRGVPDAMTQPEFERYLLEHDLYVEEAQIVEAIREPDLTGL